MFKTKKTYEEIVSGLSGMVNELREHAARHYDEANGHLEAARTHEAHADRKNKLGARSLATADKIAALLGD